MKKSFIESQKKMLLAKRQEIMDTLKGRNEQLSNLVEAAEPGDEADLASDRIDGNLALKLGDEDMRRLEHACAVYAFYKIGMTGSADGLSSFKVGDVQMQMDDRRAYAEKLWAAERESISDIIDVSGGFAFRRVRV